MKQYWNQLNQYFERLNRREKMMVFVAVLFTVGFILKILLLDKLWTQYQTVKTEIATTQSQLDTLKQQLQTIEQDPVQDANLAQKQLLTKRISERDEVIKTLGQQQKELVSPEEMLSLLGDLLQPHQDLAVLSLKTIPSEEIVIPSDKQDSAETEQKDLASEDKGKNKVVVYQHGVELVMQGSYFDLLAAVKKIEQLPWNFLWGEVELEVDTYPKAKLKLTVYTLGLEDVWLSL